MSLLSSIGMTDISVIPIFFMHILYLMAVSAQKKKTKETLQGVLVLLFFIVLMYFSFKAIGSEHMQQTIASLGMYGPILFMILKASTIIIAPLGGRPLYVIAPSLWGFWPAFIYIFIADTFAYAVIFLISRKFGRRVMGYFVTDKDMHKVDEVLNTFGTWKYFIAARFIASEFAGYAAGLTKMPFYQYMAVVIPANIADIGFALFIGHTFVKSRLSFLITLVAFSLVPVVSTMLWQKFGKSRQPALAIDHTTVIEEDA